MNLIIDVGNTKVKLAVFDKDTLINQVSLAPKDLVDAIELLQDQYHPLNRAIISNVGASNPEHLEFLNSNFDLLILDARTPVPFKNQYTSPETLGVDRIALVAAGVQNYPGQNVLIIDAGTCITYDFINDEKVYLGGAIAPGIRLRYLSLNDLTANLPLLDTAMPQGLIGDSTDQSIHSGVINGVSMEIDGIVRAYQNKFKDLTVILTGGDAKFLSNQLKSSIFAHSNFLLEGLNFILEFNANE